MISVIIPAYNVERTIGRCLESILCQSYKNIEIVIVDDGSTDMTYEICMAYKKKDQRIKLFKTSNYGVSHARNYGLERSGGRYVAFVDADDIVDFRFCETLYRVMIDTDVDLVACGYDEIKAGCSLKMRTGDACVKDENNEDEVVVYDDYSEMIGGVFSIYRGFLCNKLFRMKLIKKNKLHLKENVHMAEDMLFVVSYINYSKKVAYIKVPLYKYMIGTSTSRDLSEKWFEIMGVLKELIDGVGPRVSLHTQNMMIKEFLLAAYEARIRCKLMRKNFQEIEKQYGFSMNSIKGNYTRRILSDTKMPFKEKMRVVFYPIAKNIILRKRLSVKRGGR